MEDEITALRVALANLLEAIETARMVGCIDHTDCWNDAQEEWYDVIENAEKVTE